MSEETIKAVDAAIRAHYADLLKDIDNETRPIVSAWVIAAEIQTIEDGQLLWDNGCAKSETTSPNGALGLATWLGDELRDIRATADEEEL